MEQGKNIPIKLLLSAPESEVKERLQILVALEKEGCHADTIYFVTGERSLWFDSEPLAKKMIVERLTEAKNITQEEAIGSVDKAYNEFSTIEDEIYNKRTGIESHFVKQGIIWPTELDMIIALVQDLPELANSELIYINTPKKRDADGKIIRPNTHDGYVQFWQDYGANFTAEAKSYQNNKIPMSIITTQPYAIYQQQSAIDALKERPIDVFAVATGIKNLDETNISVIFDTIARIIHVRFNSVLYQFP